MFSYINVISFGIAALLLTKEFTTTQFIEPELKPYVIDFIGHVSKKCKDEQIFYPKRFKITFNEFKDDTVGVCKIWFYKFEIEIEKSWWDRNDEDQRISLIYHELSHCVLDLQHSDDPKDYMYHSTSKTTRQQVLNQLKSYLEGVCPDESRKINGNSK